MAAREAPNPVITPVTKIQDSRLDKIFDLLSCPGDEDFTEPEESIVPIAAEKLSLVRELS